MEPYGTKTFPFLIFMFKLNNFMPESGIPTPMMIKEMVKWRK